jgi:hypothetical protein
VTVFTLIEHYRAEHPQTSSVRAQQQSRGATVETAADIPFEKSGKRPIITIIPATREG